MCIRATTSVFSAWAKQCISISDPYSSQLMRQRLWRERAQQRSVYGIDLDQSRRFHLNYCGDWETARGRADPLPPPRNRHANKDFCADLA